ncbi:hypothetical protein [Rhizobium sp. Leaf383]|uniref:hypothetical protein n=1 Tax=Rhizobium sp. Leaf383 TaxID=1736357 RepID=UPI000715BE2F|nr:hypothetical protein [Rhizobium sp. Leaf383]KQS76383.1 hypothetical protein ASG58_11170 [Rhizobium sp. Leaf383]
MANGESWQFATAAELQNATSSPVTKIISAFMVIQTVITGSFSYEDVLATPTGHTDGWPLVYQGHLDVPAVVDHAGARNGEYGGGM